LITFQTEKDSWGSKFIIFTVPLPERPPVFMSVKVSDYGSEKSGIVIVDSEKFLQLWRNDPHSICAVANGNPQTWPNDSKYSEAMKGFSFGYADPVPLAFVAHDTATRTTVSHKFLWFGKREHYETLQYVVFTNGVTRTIWLLSQGCKAFPILCEMPGARELYRTAAMPGTPFYTIEEMARVAGWH
jgi:hypothetical protein